MFILLTDALEVGVFKHFDLMNRINLVFPKDDKESVKGLKEKVHEKNMLILNGQDFLSFDGNLDVDTLLIMNISTFELFSVRAPHFDFLKNENISVKSFKLNKEKRDASKAKLDLSSKENLVFYCKELNYLIVVDKFIENFELFSYDVKPIYSDERVNRVRFLNKKDEKQLKLFINLYTKAQYRFKIIHVDGFSFYFVMTVFRTHNNEENALLAPLNNAILSARIVSTVNRRNEKNVEVEVVKVFSFCSSYFMLRKGNKLDAGESLILGVNYNCKQELDLAREKSVFSLTEERNRKLFEMNQIYLLNLSQNRDLMKLSLSKEINLKVMNVDSDLEYLVFGDCIEKLIWLYRIRDLERLACLPIYGEINQIKFNADNRFVCLNMNDRRIFTLLIVDPRNPDHSKRIGELPSRQARRQHEINQDTVQAILEDKVKRENNSYNVDTSDESEGSDDIESEKIYKYKAHRKRQKRIEQKEMSVIKDDEQNSESNNSIFVLKYIFSCPVKIELKTELSI